MSLFKNYKFHCFISLFVLTIEVVCCFYVCAKSDLLASIFVLIALLCSQYIINSKLLPMSYRRNVWGPLLGELDAEKFRSQFSGKFGDLPSAENVIIECEIKNDVQRIIDICTSELNRKHLSKRVKSDYLYFLANIYYFMGNKEKMQEYYARFCELYMNPSKRRCMCPRSEILSNAISGDYESNIKFWGHGSSHENLYKTLVRNCDIGLTYYLLQEYDKAEQYFQEAVSIAPDSFYGNVASKYISAIKTQEPPEFADIVAHQGFELYNRKTRFLMKLRNPYWLENVLLFFTYAISLLLLLI